MHFRCIKRTRLTTVDRTEIQVDKHTLHHNIQTLIASLRSTQSPSNSHRLRVRGALLSVSPEPLESSKSFDNGSYLRQNREEYFGYAFSEDENAERKVEVPLIPFVRHSDRLFSPEKRRRSLKNMIKSVRGTKNA